MTKINPQDLQELTGRFFQDPRWHLVEELILEYVEPLKDMESIDTSQPAEHVKAEIIGRMLAFNALSKFLNDTTLVSRPIKEFKNPFK